MLGGVAMRVPENQIAQLAALPGVKAVYRDPLLRLHTDTSPRFIGAGTAWAKLQGYERAGEGVIVGVIGRQQPGGGRDLRHRPEADLRRRAPRSPRLYKVCGPETCFGSDAVAAVQQAILDGVDVINFSIGAVGDPSDPYRDVVMRPFLDAYTAGVFVAASAGNAGPAADTADNRAPWITTVGASIVRIRGVGAAGTHLRRACLGMMAT